MTEKVIECEGWTLVVHDGEALVADDVLAEHIGADGYKLRELIVRHQNAGNISPTEVFPTVGKTGGRPGKRYLLTHADALFIVTRSEAPRAVAMTKVMIRVFLAVQARLAAPPSPSAARDVSTPGVRDASAIKALLRAFLATARLDFIPGIGRHGLPNVTLAAAVRLNLAPGHALGAMRRIAVILRGLGWERTRQRWPSLRRRLSWGWLAPEGPAVAASLPPPAPPPRRPALPSTSSPRVEEVPVTLLGAHPLWPELEAGARMKAAELRRTFPEWAWKAVEGAAFAFGRDPDVQAVYDLTKLHFEYGWGRPLALPPSSPRALLLANA